MADDDRTLSAEARAPQVDRPDQIPSDVKTRPAISLPVLDDKAKGLEPPPKKPLTRRPIFYIGLFVLACILIGGFLYWQSASKYETTDDAFIDAHIVRVAPQVSGILDKVPVEDNQHVKPGDLLAEIEPSGPLTLYNQSVANLANAQSQLTQARAQAVRQQAAIGAARATRQQQLANIGVPLADLERAQRDLSRYLEVQKINPAAVAQTTIDQQRAAVKQAQAQVAANEAATSNAARNIIVQNRDLLSQNANVLAAEAKVKQAEAEVAQQKVNLNNLRLTASVPGHIANRTVNVGSYVSPGTQIMALVPDDIWVTANFKETQLRGMKIGQVVDLKVDALPNVHFVGHIDSFQRGAGQAFQLLPPENATGNYVKVVQRVPVKIVFDVGNGHPNPVNYPVGPGMSVSPRVHLQ